MIYFIRGKESGNIKIGYSADPEQRKSNLQTANYEELEFIGIMDGSLEDEARIQKMFSAFNIRGEWYNPAKEVVDFAERNAIKSKERIITSFRNGYFRITLPEPMKYSMNFFLSVRQYNIKVLTDIEYGLVFGIEGKRDTLLSFLENIEGATKEIMDEYKLLMTD